MANNNGTLVVAPIRPYSDLDAFPSAYANEIKGGLHTVANDAALSALPEGRREDGMVVVVLSSAAAGNVRHVYQLNGTVWEDFAPSGTVKSVTAGNGMTQTGTSTVDPTLNIVSNAGSAGTIGTINISADAIGVNLGTTSTTAFRGDYGDAAYTGRIATFTTTGTSGNATFSSNTLNIPNYTYTLPLAANGTRGGVQIGYTATGANLPVALSSEKMYVALTSTAIENQLTGNITTHTHTYDNYGGWNLYVDTADKGNIASGEKIDFKGGTNITLTYTTTNSNTITIDNDYTYTLPLSANGTRGGVQIGYTATGANLPVALSSEKMYVALTKSAIENQLTGNITSHTHSYDNYGGWILYTDGTTRGNIASSEIVNFIGGTNVTLSYATTNNAITINAAGYTLTKAAVEGVLTGLITTHTHSYDNYNGWDLVVDSSTPYRISSGENVVFSGGTNITLDYSTTGTNTVTINSTGIAGSTLNISTLLAEGQVLGKVGGVLAGLDNGTGISFGADNQIPYTNSTTDDFDYSGNFTYNGTTLNLDSEFQQWVNGDARTVINQDIIQIGDMDGGEYGNYLELDLTGQPNLNYYGDGGVLAFNIDPQGAVTTPSSITASGGNSGQWNTAYAHVSSTGAQHSYINQNVTTTGTPTFAGLTVTGNLSATSTLTTASQDFKLLDTANNGNSKKILFQNFQLDDASIYVHTGMMTFTDEDAGTYTLSELATNTIYAGWDLLVNSGTYRISSDENVAFVGGTDISLGYTTTNNTVTINYTGTGGGTPGGSNTQVQYNSSGTFAGSANFTFDGTNVTAGDFILTSDPRAKDVESEVTNGLEILKNITPVNYKWKDRRNDFDHIGYLTTDVEKVRPELVIKGTTEEEYDSLSYTRFTAINTAAIKELHKIIEDLQKEINELKNG